MLYCTCMSLTSVTWWLSGGRASARGRFSGFSSDGRASGRRRRSRRRGRDIDGRYSPISDWKIVLGHYLICWDGNESRLSTCTGIRSILLYIYIYTWFIVVIDSDWSLLVVFHWEFLSKSH